MPEDFAMPLRDHFHSPVDDFTSWESFHASWPVMMVARLRQKLPSRYLAAPRAHWGSSVEADLPSLDEYEVRVYDTERGRALVAAVEIVSPSNKDRPEHRRAFVAKCAALLQERVSVTIVDLVTTRNFNLYADLLDLIGATDATLPAEPPSLYAAACRTTRPGDAWLIETWPHALILGQPLPTLPLWLADNFAVPLELDESYEETCHLLRIA
jgi:Protein of unknown function (DUF4058)